MLRCARVSILDQIAGRFWSKVAIAWKPNGDPDFSKCWPWRACLGSGRTGRYGRFRLLGKIRKAHRIAFALYYRRWIPAHLDGAHTCDNPPCCNPTHTRPATNRANIAEWWMKKRNGYLDTIPKPRYEPLTACTREDPYVTDSELRRLRQARSKRVRARVSRGTRQRAGAA